MAALIVFHVQDAVGASIGGALLTARSPAGDWAGRTNACGDFLAYLAPAHYDITIAAPGFADRLLPADLGDCGEVTIGLDRALSVRATLVTRGPFFETITGDPWTVIEATDFRLFERFLRGEAIEPVVVDRVQLGFNTLRVALTCANMFRLVPNDWPNYFDRLQAFIAALGTYGLMAECVVFMDAPTVMPAIGVQRAFYADVVAALDVFRGGVLIELVNEADQPANMLDVAAFAPPAGQLAAHGSNGSQAWPVAPAWTYATMHFNDAPEFQRKTGHNSMEVADAWHVPTIANENTRFPDRDASTMHAFDAAAGAALLCAGSCYHSVSGKESVPFPTAERACAQAWADGARSVELRFQAGAYRHAIELETASDLRVYQRVLPSGDACTVRIRR